MRKLILKMSMSVDGFVAGPNGELDWLFRTSDSESAAAVRINPELLCPSVPSKH